jgi:hypothetical protein
MWKATLQSITDTPVPTDSVEVQITFSDDGGKQFTQSFQFSSASMTSPDALVAFAEQKIAQLVAFDDARSAVEERIGKDLASSDPKANETIKAEIAVAVAAAAELKPIKG